MLDVKFSTALLICCAVVGLELVFAEKYKICVVDGRGGYQKTSKYCPDLTAADSEVECVQAVDRFDCLSKMRKGHADFSIFTPEDLIVASNTYNEILITSELSSSKPYEQSLVAVVNEKSGIANGYDLSGKVLCHPGDVDDGIVSNVLNNYLEMTVVRPQQCVANLSIPENRLSSTSKFFKSACKPGRWVPDKEQDVQLKNKYRNLCSSCSSDCSKDDKYFGYSGSLLCLRDGAGDVAWTTLTQVRSQFNLQKPKVDLDLLHRRPAEIDGFRYLCPNGGLRPLNATNPCVWVAKPWSVVAATRSSSPGVRRIVDDIRQINASAPKWKFALFNLLKVVRYNVEINTLANAEPVESYLNKIPGFLSANSFTGCHPPRTVRICTTSILSKYKCDWMREGAAVRGVEPDVDCLKADNVTHCMKAIKLDVADVVLVDPDHVHQAKDFDLETLFYEVTDDKFKYKTVALIRENSEIKSFKDLRGKRACFPNHGGIGWNSVINKLKGDRYLDGCPYEKAMQEFFGESCVPNVPDEYKGKLGKLCEGDYAGDIGALNCLLEKNADVAFISNSTLELYQSKIDSRNFKVLCPSTDSCHLSWDHVGRALVYRDLTEWKKKDVLDSFLQLDGLFGRNYKEPTPVFTMYGKFSGVPDVLFHDNTHGLRKEPIFRYRDNLPLWYGKILGDIDDCKFIYSGGKISSPSVLFGAISLIILILR